MAINYVKIITAAFHSTPCSTSSKNGTILKIWVENFKMIDLHLPLVNKYDVKTLHVS